MIAIVLAVALASGMTTAQSDVPTVSLSDIDAVKASYTAANYDEALQRIAEIEPGRVTPQLEQYRALSLLALGRSAEAGRAFERLVRQAPLYRLTEADVSPRIATTFRDVRRRLLPSIAREIYARGKSSYDQKRYAQSSAELNELLKVLNDADLEGQSAGVDDLKQLAEGFIRLAEAEMSLAARVASPAAPVAPASAPAPVSDPSAAVITKIIIYTAADANVTPPVEIDRRMPPWAPPAVIARSNMEYRGELRIVVNEIGVVESAFVSRPTVPSYDLTLLEAARRWRFKPAMLNNQPVKYQLSYNVALTPRR
ncbi:MAG: energy transducer TonB [Acidobacteriota bacterium]